MIEKLTLSNFRVVEKYHSQYGNISYSEPIIKTKAPFVIVLHSLGKNENQAIKFANLLPDNTFVLAVRAPIEWRVDGDESFAWFDVKGAMIEQFCKEDDIVNSVDHLIKIIEEFKSKNDNLDDPIIIGFSQGGIVGLTMAVEKCYKVKGLFCHCGFYENKLNKGFNNIEIPILMTNGLKDPIIPSVWVDTSSKLLKEKCKNFESYFFDGGHEITNDVLLKLKVWLNKVL